MIKISQLLSLDYYREDLKYCSQVDIIKVTSEKRKVTYDTNIAR